MYEAIGDKPPLKRVGKPEEIAQAWAFYLMQNRFSTGSCGSLRWGEIASTQSVDFDSFSSLSTHILDY